MQRRVSVKGPDAPGPIRRPRVNDDDEPPPLPSAEQEAEVAEPEAEEDRAVL